MAIRVEKKKLLDALTSIKLNVPQSDMSDVSKYTIFQNGRIHAFNDVAGMTIPFDADMDNCVVDSVLLWEFVKNVPDKEFLMGLKDGALRVQGASKIGDDIIMAEFALRDDLVYPSELIEDNPNEYSNLPETFYTALSYTAFACDDESAVSSRIAIKDGYAYSKGRLAACKFYLGDEAVSMIPEPMFVSPSAIGFVNRDAPKKYFIKNGWLHLMNEAGIVLSMRTRIDPNFPFKAIDEMLVKGSAEEFRLPANIRDILLRCVPFSGHSAKIRKVDVRLDKGVMSVTANRSDGSRFLEKTKCGDTASPIVFSINVKTFSDVIELADKYQTDGYRLLGFGTNFVTMISIEASND